MGVPLRSRLCLSIADAVHAFEALSLSTSSKNLRSFGHNAGSILYRL